MKNYDLNKILIVLLIIAVGSYVLTLAWGVLGNFIEIFIILIIAWLLSFILEPLVYSIQRLSKFSKVISTIITYILILIALTAIIFLYIPIVGSQIIVLMNIVPGYLNTAPKIVVDWSASVFSQLGNSFSLVPSATQFLSSSLFVLILSFYFIVDRERINIEFFNLVPKNWHEVLHFTQKVIHDTFDSFLRVQLFFGLSSGILTWIILRAFNIEFAASIAFLAGIFAIIPLLGPLLAIIPPVLVSLLVDPVKALIIGLILLIFQQVIFNVLGPKLLGKAFRLHPAIILISFLIGLKFAGGLGGFFAIPVLGVGAVMIRKFGHYFLKIKD